VLEIREESRWELLAEIPESLRTSKHAELLQDLWDLCNLFGSVSRGHQLIELTYKNIFTSFKASHADQKEKVYIDDQYLLGELERLRRLPVDAQLYSTALLVNYLSELSFCDAGWACCPSRVKAKRTFLVRRTYPEVRWISGLVTPKKSFTPDL
jgi:hypothetical protein